jgi:hypothetical protein
MNQMALKVEPEEEIDTDDMEAMQLEALIALEETMKIEEHGYPVFADVEGYVTSVVIGGTALDTNNVASLLAESDESWERVSKEEVAEAMKALRTMDDGDEDQIIFDTGCTAHILKSAEGLMSGKRQMGQP